LLPHPCRRLVSRLSILTILGLVWMAFDARAQFQLPTGFADELVVGGLDQPINFTFLPDGRVLLVERETAKVRMVVNDALAAVDPVLVVDSVRIGYGEQGLLGLAVDPAWPARPYLYVYYNYSGGPYIRLSRYRAAGDLSFLANGSITVDPSTRYDILSNIPDLSQVHNAGSLLFGQDGMLYVAVGDDNSLCRAQDLTFLNGKILRIDVSRLPDGPGSQPAIALLVPNGNPFGGHSFPNARLVWQWGLRNPWSFHIDRLSGDLMIADVGGNQYEEVDWAPAPGLNFQWPIYEGPAPLSSCFNVDSSAFADPVYYYAHETVATVISGVFYRRPPGATRGFPPEYEGRYFFHDFYRGFLRWLRREGNSWTVADSVAGQPSATDWANGQSWVSRFSIAPDGSIWYCRNWTVFPEPTGQLRRIVRLLTADAPLPEVSGWELRPPVPSPGRGRVQLTFVLPVAASVVLEIHDLAGRRIRRLLGPELRGAGRWDVAWDGTDSRGRRVASGVYWVRLGVAGRDVVQRLPWLTGG
jgi:glucose/arabinose dehydrogenase